MNNLYKSDNSKLGDIYEKTTNPTVGNKYHLSWAMHSCVWKLVEIVDLNWCWLETPKTKKRIKAKIEDLRLLSKAVPKNCYKPY